MRPEVLYLHDIVQAAEAIGRFVAGIRRREFIKDELRQAGVLQKLIVIGEAAAHLSKEFKAQHPKIEWADIVGFRNIAVHESFWRELAHRVGHGDGRRPRLARKSVQDTVR